MSSQADMEMPAGTGPAGILSSPGNSKPTRDVAAGMF
jgi:hypothetical protein